MLSSNAVIFDTTDTFFCWFVNPSMDSIDTQYEKMQQEFKQTTVALEEFTQTVDSLLREKCTSDFFPDNMSRLKSNWGHDRFFSEDLSCEQMSTVRNQKMHESSFHDHVQELFLLWSSHTLYKGIATLALKIIGIFSCVMLKWTCCNVYDFFRLFY